MTTSMSLRELASLALPLDKEGFCRAFPSPALVLSAPPKSPVVEEVGFSTLSGKRRTRLSISGAVAFRNGAERPEQTTKADLLTVLFVVKSTRNPFLAMITVGRAANNDLVLNDPTISKVHAHITWASSASLKLSRSRSCSQMCK